MIVQEILINKDDVKIYFIAQNHALDLVYTCIHPYGINSHGLFGVEQTFCKVFNDSMMTQVTQQTTLTHYRL
jgi:hypothetical protein